jgi:hypothetical protein
MSAGSFWFKTLDGSSETGVTRYWLHKRLRDICGWRSYRMAQNGVIYKMPGKYPLGEWGVNG